MAARAMGVAAGPVVGLRGVGLRGVGLRGVGFVAGGLGRAFFSSARSIAYSRVLRTGARSGSASMCATSRQPVLTAAASAPRACLTLPRRL